MRLPSLITIASLLLAVPVGIVLPTPYTRSPMSAVLAQAPQNGKAEADRLLQMGIQQYQQGKSQESLEPLQQAISLFRQLGDHLNECRSLVLMGLVYSRMGQSQKALAVFEQALIIIREIDDRAGEGRTLNYIGSIYNSLGQYGKALEYYQKALAISKEIRNRSSESTSLSNIGSVYASLGQYSKALEYFQQALAIAKEIGNHSSEGISLSNIGFIDASLGQYGKALEYYQKALAISKEIGDRFEEGRTLNSIGFIDASLGQYGKALEYYQKALAISEEIGDRFGEGRTLNNIAGIYYRLGQYGKALEYYQKALATSEEIEDHSSEGISLSNIGFIDASLGQYGKALEYYQKALAISKGIGNRSSEGISLNNIGSIYASLGQYSKALEYFQRALAIAKEIGDRSSEGISLSNIGFLLKMQKQPQLAIVFYKQSVNVHESIRNDIRKLPHEQQESYIKSVADTYRSLADLLLKQDRVLEAQQVLDLLKVQELEDYLHNVRAAHPQTGAPPFTVPEQPINAKLEALNQKAVAVGLELSQLENKKNPTPADQQRKIELRQQEQEITKEFETFLATDPVVQALKQRRQTTDGQDLNPEIYARLQRNLQKFQAPAAILYPLVLPDRLELVLVTSNAPPIHQAVPIKQEDLNHAIVKFRQTLQDPTEDARPLAQQFYTWLIQPIEPYLTKQGIQTIIYAPDGQLRYIPLAALYNGQQWLVQRFRLDNITAATLTDFTPSPSSTLKVLAAAFTQGTHHLQVGTQRFDLSGLPNAATEVKELTRLIPDTTERLNEQFNPGLVNLMPDYSVIHLATHAYFSTSGQPTDSFILFGDGHYATLRDVETWKLTNVDLVVLSACQTGEGGVLGDGREILGFGYVVQDKGARAVLSSLWSVDDRGTQLLMDAFYAELKAGKTKAEALQQAQIALITGNYTVLGQKRGGVNVELLKDALPKTVTDRLNHPYYWAPFILIGNGL